MIDSANAGSSLGTSKDLRWKVPAASVLYLKVGVSGDLDLKLTYIALSYKIISRSIRGKGVEKKATSSVPLPISWNISQL
jgi:hypothetical protein